uniref:Uncharacterized protein n=1 Tax=Rhizophora mucronata TaxID=61149 RepID=A0A2P2JCG6_RHIMU
MPHHQTVSYGHGLITRRISKKGKKNSKKQKSNS